MAEIIWTDGARKTVAPISEEEGFELKYLQDLVGGFVEVVNLPDSKIMIIDEEGKLKGREVNEAATEIYRKATGSTDTIVGTVLICESSQLK